MINYLVCFAGRAILELMPGFHWEETWRGGKHGKSKQSVKIELTASTTLLFPPNSHLLLFRYCGSGIKTGLALPIRHLFNADQHIRDLSSHIIHFFQVTDSAHGYLNFRNLHSNRLLLLIPI